MTKNEKSSKLSTYIGLVISFALWYGFNAGYNVYNAYVKKDLPFPIFVATLQLSLGLLYAIPLYIFGFREVPRLTFSDIIKLLPIGMQNSLIFY